MMCPWPLSKIHSFPRLGGLHHPYAVACVSVLNTLFIGRDSRTRKSPPVVLIPTSGSATLFSQHHDHGLENGDLHLWSMNFCHKRSSAPAGSLASSIGTKNLRWQVSQDAMAGVFPANLRIVRPRSVIACRSVS